MDVPIKRDGTEYTFPATEIVEKREADTRNSLHGESGATGSGRSAAFSAVKRVVLV